MRIAGVRRLVAGSVLMGLLVAALPAGAGTLSGLSGLLTVPTADVLPWGGLEAGVHLAGKGAHGAGDRIVVTVVSSPMDNVEVGLTNLRRKDHFGEFELALKGLVFAETANQPGVAAGFDPGWAFVVASRRVAPRVRIHAGYGYGEHKGFFGGASIALSTASTANSALRTPAVTAMAEYTPAGANVGARLIFTPFLSADVGLMDLGGSEEWIAGVSYRRSF